jgi:hypothetical protein
MAMDRQQFEAALSLLLEQMEGETEDRHELYQRLMQILGAMRATGMPLPDDLVRLEREMEEEFGAAGPDEPGEG